MAELANERVAYFNGEIVPESRVMVSFRDREFLHPRMVSDDNLSPTGTSST